MKSFRLGSECLLDCIKEFIILFICRKIRIILLDLFCRLEEESRLGGLDHTKVVKGITAGDGIITDGLQSLYGRKLRLLTTHLESGDLTIRCNLKSIAEDGRPTQFLHERCCKLFKGIGQNDDLGQAAKFI